MKTSQGTRRARIAAALGCLLFAGLAWGFGSELFENPLTEKSYPNKTVAGFLGVESDGMVEVQTGPQPKQGEVLRGVCGTASGMGTNTVSCARFDGLTDLVRGVGTISGTNGYLPKKTTSGWGDSQFYDDGTRARMGTGTSTAKLSSAGSFEADDAVIAGASQGFQSKSYLYDAPNPIWSFSGLSNYGIAYYHDNGSHPGGSVGDAIGFHFGLVTLPTFYARYDGTLYSMGSYTLFPSAFVGLPPTTNNFGHMRLVYVSDGSTSNKLSWGLHNNNDLMTLDGTGKLVLSGAFSAQLPGKGIGKVLYDTDGAGNFAEGSLSNIGAEPALAACSPGQAVIYTGAGTSLTTTKGCGTLTGANVTYSTATPTTVGSTSGAAGTDTSVVRSDHAHPCRLATSGQDGCMSKTYADEVDGLYSNRGKVKAFSSSDEQYLYGATASSDGSIVLAQYGTGTSAQLDIRANFGTGATNVCSGADSRLSNARTPTTHGGTHLTGAGDPVPLVNATTDGLMIHGEYAALNSRTSTPGTASRITVSDANGKLTGWIDEASGSTRGTMSIAHYNLINGASATPGAGVVAKGDSNGELTSWVKAFKDSETSLCASDYSAGTAWVTVASINCTLATAGTVYAYGLIRYSTNNSSWHYVGIRILLDSTEEAESVRVTKTAKLIGSSYDYDSISTVALITIANTSSHTCYLQILSSTSSSDYVQCSGDSGNQGGSITVLKMYK